MSKRRNNSGGPGLYRIGAVSDLTGISAHALRAWERRYKEAFEPSRAEGGQRLYSENEVTRLRLIKRLLDSGNSIRPLVGLSLEQLERAIQTRHDSSKQEPAPGLQELRERTQAALLDLDIIEADRLLSRALVDRSVPSFIVELAVPLLEALCELWQRGELRRAHEHACFTVFRGILCTLMRLQSASAHAPGLLIATLPDEPQEFASLVVAFVGLLHDWRIHYVGPLLPANEIHEAAMMTGAEQVAVAFMRRPSPEAAAQLLELVQLLPGEVPLLLTGRGMAGGREWAKLATVAFDLLSLDEHLSRSSTASRSTRRALKNVPRCSV